MNPTIWRLKNLIVRARGWREELAARGIDLGGFRNVPTGGRGGALRVRSELRATVFRANDDHVPLAALTPEDIARRIRKGWREAGRVLYSPGCAIEDYGLLSRRFVTNDGVAFLVDAFQNLVELESMNAHAIGTGNTAENVADTALVTEVETRVSGTQSEPASNQYRTTGTQTATSARAVVEHGVFNSTTPSGSKLLDRSVFSVINLAISDSIQNQYTLTLTAGG